MSYPSRSWIEFSPEETDQEVKSLVGGYALLAQALYRRGIHTLQDAAPFLDPLQYVPTPAETLPDLTIAVERLERAIQEKETVGVWGDFDVDGQSATTVLVSTLRDLGARVSYHIPIRQSESHGVNLAGLKRMVAAGAKVILTCDTGVAAHEAAKWSREQGVDFLITDHHELPETLPKALAVVNPRRLMPGHPLGDLPGVGVAYKLAEALYEQFGCPERAEGLLDLVALGIVADVAMLRGDTRYLLQKGLKALRSTRRFALRAMFELASIDPLYLSEEHIGFTIAPRLNAVGRLGDANPIVEFFLHQDCGRVQVIAQQLEGLNAERQLKTSQILKGALEQIEKDPNLLQAPVLVLSHPSWPAGIIGIVASRLVELFRKPVVLLSMPLGEPGRGSARSVEGFHITQAIAKVQANDPDLILGFGGHPMAAGLSLAADRLEDFRRALWKASLDIAGETMSSSPLLFDGELALSEATLEFAEVQEKLAPFGPGNTLPMWVARRIRIVRETSLGRESDHSLLTVEDRTGERYKVIWWGGRSLTRPEEYFDLAYTLRATTYNGRREPQLTWVDFQSIEEDETVELSLYKIQVKDYRDEPHPLLRLETILSQEKAQVWCEGPDRQLLVKHCIEIRDRSGLEPGGFLVLWTTPPGLTELRQALEKVKPEKVAVFAVDPETGTLEAFLQRLGGIVKYALREHSGNVSWQALLSETAQRENAVRLGLDWWAAKGSILVRQTEVGNVQFEVRSGQPTGDEKVVARQLQTVLAEAAAFREYFRRVKSDDLQTLIG